MKAGGVPISTKAKLMVDTGAQNTVIDEVLASTLGIQPVRHMQMVGVSQKPEMCPVYMMAITIGMSSGRDTAEVTFATHVVGMKSMPQANQCQGLLGRDFLQHFLFHYNGPAGRFEIEAVKLPPPPQLTKAQQEAEEPLTRQARRRLERKRNK